MHSARGLEQQLAEGKEVVDAEALVEAVAGVEMAQEGAAVVNGALPAAELVAAANKLRASVNGKVSALNTN